MSRHTQGSWEVRYTNVKGLFTNVVQVAGKEKFVAITEMAGISREEQEANAHLIAAAPDLLAALELFAEPNPDKLVGISTRTMVNKARLAIKKARGG